MQQRTLSRAKEKERQRWREIKSEVDGGQGEHHCNLSHTLWQHVCRHFYHFRIYVVSAWAASKLRSRPLLYCPIRSDKRSLSLSVQLPVSSPVPPFSNRNKCGLANRRGTAIFAAQAARASMVSQGPHALHWRPNELFWFNLSNQTEQNRTEHWATIWPPLGHRRSRHRSCNARKVNIYVGQGAHCKWGFIQCAEMNYCANTSDEFCT